MTTVASSVALVCTQPIWVVLVERLRGRPVTARTGIGVGVAVVGVVLLTGVDVTVSTRALWGDLLALAGGAFAAGYVLAGAEARRVLPNPVYTLGCYGLAGLLLGALAVADGQAMAGYDSRTWWLLVALMVGPQLLGHSVFNRVLPSVGATVVSVAILLEVLGAALIAWWWFDEVPPAAAIPAAALLLAGLYLTVTGDRTGPVPTGPPATPGSPPARLGVPGRIRLTGTSSFLPDSVRGIAGTASMRSGTWRGDSSTRRAAAMRARRSSSSVDARRPARRTAPARPAAVVAGGVLEVHDEAVGHLGQGLDHGVEVAGAEADAAAVEGGVGAAGDGAGAVVGEGDPVAVAPHAREVGEVGGPQPRAVGVAPEPDGHRRHRRGDDQLAGGARRHRLAVGVERLHRAAEEAGG